MVNYRAESLDLYRPINWAVPAVCWQRVIDVCGCSTGSRVPVLCDVTTTCPWWHGQVDFNRRRHTVDWRSSRCDHWNDYILVDDDAVSSSRSPTSVWLHVHYIWHGPSVNASSYLLLRALCRRLVSAGSVGTHAQLFIGVQRRPFDDRKDLLWWQAAPLCTDWW